MRGAPGLIRYSLACMAGVEAGWRARAWLGLLRVASAGYGLGVGVRNRLFDVGLLRPGRVPCRIVSVGNLTAGGTGKTPCVALLARMLEERSRKVAILLRGYGGRARGVRIVSEGSGILAGPDEVGDEAILLARKLPRIPVAVGADRRAAAMEAVRRWGPDLILLDDGFQHRRLYRDLDILLIDATRPWGYGHLVPRGLLREGRRGLGRADVIIVSRAEEAAELSALRAALAATNPRALILMAAHRPATAVCLPDGRSEDLEAIEGLPALAFSGIANPEAFTATLRRAGAKVVRTIAFPDHHPFCARDLEDLQVEARAAGAALLVTTEKDAVRLPPPGPAALPVYALAVEFVILEGEAGNLLGMVEGEVHGPEAA